MGEGGMTQHMNETQPGHIDLRRPLAPGDERPCCRVIAVTGGKGGVGKTTVVTNLAVALARRGARVMVLDADLGLANVDVLLGLNPTYTLQHVLLGERSITEVAVTGPAGVQIVPAATGIEELTHLGVEERLLLLEQVDALDGAFDILLIDTAAGISSNVLYFNSAAHDVLVVVTPEPTAITDAYALMKVLATRHGLERFSLLVNQAAGDGEARRTHAQIARVTERFLRVGVDYMGYVPFDETVQQSVRAQVSLMERAPGAPAAHALGRLAERVLGRAGVRRPSGGSQFFFRGLLEQARA
jgi:flagellar biosynthesis protein FlhG